MRKIRRRGRTAAACALAAAAVLAPSAMTAAPASASPFRPLTGIRVVPAKGAVTVYWYDDVTRRAVGYRITAVTQQLYWGSQTPPQMKVTVPKRRTTTEQKVLFRNLKPGVPYVFWIEVIGKRARGAGVYYEQVFSSPGVRPL